MTGGRIERRLAAVLAADVAGYSRLMGADEVGTLSTLKAHRREVVDPAIASHKGRIVKTTGDGMLVEFGSAVDAVTCAMAVQEKMTMRNGSFTPAISFRIGINIGDIIIDGDDIFGDGVNVAARVENECEPGGVCLSGSAFEQVRGKTAYAFDDLGERSLKNIDRPVRLYAARLASSPPAGSINAAAIGTKSLVLPDRPSIAVLPFQNMSGDAEQEYFADGMVEDIITALSRFKSLFVIARNSSFTYKGKAVDIKQVGRELGVRYVLEGSVRKAGDKVRITGQLIDATTGAHLWADKIDGALTDIFELQDVITSRVAGTIEPTITKAELDRAQLKPTSSLDAYDLYLRALAVHYSQTKSDLEAAFTYLESAIKIDPSYAWAKAFAAYIICLKRSQGWATADTTTRGSQLAKDALLGSGDEPNTIGFAAHALAWLARDFEVAVAAMDRAMVLNPNSFGVLIRSGHLRNWVDDFATAIDHFSRSIRVNPLDPQIGYAYAGIAGSHIYRGEHDQGLLHARLASQSMPSWVWGWLYRAAAAAYMGDLGEARECVRRILELSPSYSIRTLRVTSARRQYRPDLEEGLRLGGLPD